MSSWADVLDSLEEQLRRQEAALRGEAEAPPDMALPLLDEAFPPDLVPRALSLLDRARALQRIAAEKVNRRRPTARAYGGGGRAVGDL